MGNAYEAARKAFDEYAGMGTGQLPDYDWMASLQVRLHRWQVQQFGYVAAEKSVLGVSEECGELAEACLALMAASGRLSHATLKASQKIRGMGDRETARKAVADALADICIFAMQVATDMRLDFGTILEKTAEEVMERNWRSEAVK